MRRSPSASGRGGRIDMAGQGFGEVAEQLRRSTVQVQSHGRQGSGSGVIWSKDGVIVTNAHVARDSRAKVALWDGSAHEATLVSRDTRRDLASLKIDASIPQGDLGAGVTGHVGVGHDDA